MDQGNIARQERMAKLLRELVYAAQQVSQALEYRNITDNDPNRNLVHARNHIATATAMIKGEEL